VNGEMYVWASKVQSVVFYLPNDKEFIEILRQQSEKNKETTSTISESFVLNIIELLIKK
jgi:hypothetical protein